MALFQYEGIGSLRSLGNRFTTQRAVYSYSQFSILNYEELSYGSITDAVVEAEDYGEITASIEQYYQIQDFGTITLDTTGVPMGKIGIHLSADDTTTRVSVGGVEFALFGRAITEVFFNPVDRVFDFQGVAVDRTTSSWLGRGVLPPVEAEALDAVVAIPPTSIFHLSTKGSAKTEVIFNKQDRIFDIIGEAGESRSYLFDEEDAIDFRSDDFGFLNETVLRSEDYGDVNYIQTITGHPFIIEPNDLTDPSYQSVFFSTKLETGGTGSGTSGGFNIGPHISFRERPPRAFGSGYNLERYFEFESDTRHLDLVSFDVIKGSGSNGGESPDDSSEDLVFQYLSSNGTWQEFGRVSYANSSFNTLKTYTATLPAQARNYGQRFRVYCALPDYIYNIGPSVIDLVLDHWGVKNIQFQELTTGTGLSEDDFGLISVDITTKAATGRMPFGGGATESFVKGNYTGSVGNKQPRLVGTAIDYTIPKHQGFGWINIDGSPRVQIRMHYKADGGWDFYPNRFRGGSLFGFADAADATAVLNEGSGKLFTVKSTTTFKAVRSEVGVSEEDILVQGGADYEVIFNQVDRVFSFNNEEINRRAFAYNLSSVVNVESIDYGFITDTITVAEDYGDVSYDEIYYPWQIEDFGTLAPTTTRLPFGLGRLHSSTETPRVRRFVGNIEETNLRLLGTGKVYVLPKFTSKGDLVKLRGDTTFSRARDWVGTGNLPTLSGAADAVAFVPAKDDRALFNFEGELVEKFGKGNYDGVGTLFGFDTNTVSIILSTVNDGLFSVHGEVVEKSVFREIGSGSLGSVIGAAERVTFHYNQESSFGACEGDDYGFIRESVYNVEESPELSGYLSDPIISLANEVVSEFGRVPNQIDYGYVNQYYQYNHEDYGTLFPDDCLEPQGLQLDFVGTAPEAFSKGNYAGSGSIFSFTGTAEAVAFVPGKKKALFGFEGNAAESTTPTTEIGSGSLFSLVTFEESATFVPALRIDNIDPLFEIGGGLRISAVNEQESELKFTAAWAASGSLFGFVGSGEATGQEEFGSGTIFIRDSGLRIEPESFTPWIPAGRGSIFSFVSFTEAAAFVPAKKNPLFGFSGAATDVQFSFAYETIQTTHLLVRGTPKIFVLPKHTGAGSFFVRSSGVRIEPESFTPFIPEGSGKLFGGIGGAAEAVGANPPDDFTLFTFTGQVDTPLLTFSEQKFVQARFLPDEAFTTFQLRVTETGLQPVEVLGELDESFTPAPEVGTGRLYGFTGAAEAAVFNPIDKTTLFSFEGNAAERETNVEIGSGSFFSFQSATEVTAVAEEKQALFSFAGNLRESVAPAPHVTTGGLFGFSSTTEAKVFDLPERTTLFSVTGTAIESASIAEEGTATPGLDVNGNLVERASFAHAGTGSIFGFSSTTEARVIVPRGLRNLFTVTGNSPESETNVEIGSGTLTGFVGGAESTSNVEVKFTLFTIGGDTIGGDVKFTSANLAVGQVRIGLSNDGIPGDISRGITIFRLRTFPEGAKVRFTGTKAESFTPAPHVSEGLVNINRGNEVTEDRYIEFKEPQPTRIVVI
jgi:hypothetical protein